MTATTKLKRRSLLDEMAVDVPEGEHGDVVLDRFTIGDGSSPSMDLANMLEGVKRGRDSKPGTYSRLSRHGTLWMTDTWAERRDHMTAAHQIAGWRPDESASSVLIGGLGLGMILRVALLTPGMQRVDVVEIDADVIALVSPHYVEMAAERGVELTLHERDLFDVSWTKGTRWDVAWFDIWPTLCSDDLDEHATLARRYARRTNWYGCWGHELLVRARRRDRASGGWW